MRINIKIASLLACLALSSMLLSCKDDPKQSPLEKAEKLVRSSVWVIQSAELDGIDYTDLYPNLSVTFNDDGTYATQNAVPPVWEAAGTYVVQSPQAIELDGSRQVTVSDLTSTNLTLTFQYVGSGSKMSSVGGEYTFTFTAQ